MSLIAAVRTGASTDVLTSLRAICDSQGLHDLSAHLADLADLVQWDMRDLEAALQGVPDNGDVVHRSAHHLLAAGGKRLRPMCVALASRVGTGFSEAAREMGVAVELVHCATLLHDDVIDLGDQRRGQPAARTVYGNAASIFAGDWLLIEALRRVQAVGVSNALERLLEIIDEMIAAEAIQLENRGRLNAREETYFKVVEGKTAALFRWAMYAGGLAGGLPRETCSQLEEYGLNLGIAFQLVDDLLDYIGDATATGKALFTDLREGKMTHPVIVALQRDPSLKDVLEPMMTAGQSEGTTTELHDRLIRGLEQTGAIEETRALAVRKADDACANLQELPDGRAKDALLTVAQATAHRES